MCASVCCARDCVHVCLCVVGQYFVTLYLRRHRGEFLCVYVYACIFVCVCVCVFIDSAGREGIQRGETRGTWRSWLGAWGHWGVEGVWFGKGRVAEAEEEAAGQDGGSAEVDVEVVWCGGVGMRTMEGRYTFVYTLAIVTGLEKTGPRSH